MLYPYTISMVHYLLPGINYSLTGRNLKLKFRDEKEATNFVSKSISKYLNSAKLKINDHIDAWDAVKKTTNPHEFIHTNLPNAKYSISKIKPLSRAFFKLIEICNTFDLFKYTLQQPITSFHLAEGPGGFIEALTYLRFNKKDIYYGMTLSDIGNGNVPGWKKATSFLNRNTNVIIEEGEDGTGNLYKPANFSGCYKKYKNSIDFITADGGFDFSVDFNKQELMALRLIFSEVAYAIIMQSLNGTFILKMFDIFLRSSVDILYILSCFYSEVHIIKPNTSRAANSEKYVVCTGFKYTDTAYIYNKLYSIFVILDNNRIDDLSIATFIDKIIPHRFKNAIEEINAILGRQQIDNILITLRFIQSKERKGEKIQQIKNTNIQKCITWCTDNKIPYNSVGYSGNIFLPDSNSRTNMRLRSLA